MFRASCGASSVISSIPGGVPFVGCMCPPVMTEPQLLQASWCAGLTPSTTDRRTTATATSVVLGEADSPIPGTVVAMKGALTLVRATLQIWHIKSHFWGVHARLGGLCGVGPRANPRACKQFYQGRCRVALASKIASTSMSVPGKSYRFLFLKHMLQNQ